MTLEVNAWVGAPFAVGGRGPAYDCWGLVQAIYRDRLGIALPGYDQDYFEINNRHIGDLIDAERRKWRLVTRPEPGDVVLFRIYRFPGHVGIVTGSGTMINTRKGCGAVIEPYLNPKWRPRLVGFYRHHPDHR